MKRITFINNVISFSNAIKVEQRVTIKRMVNKQCTNNKKGNKSVDISFVKEEID